MDDNEDVWLTDREAGLLLRRSPEAVKRLRLSGQLSYLSGRPVRIRLSDLNAYIDRNMVLAHAERPAPEQRAIMNAEARQWALKARFKATALRRKR